MLRMLALAFMLCPQAVPDGDLALLLRGPLALLTGGPWMTARERDEALGDALMVFALTANPGEARADLARRANELYMPLAIRLLGRLVLDDELLRLLWKHARCLAESDRERLARFFENFTKRGYAPGWDADETGRSRWGWRDSLERLRPR
jgi:hypothetical protein